MLHYTNANWRIQCIIRDTTPVYSSPTHQCNQTKTTISTVFTRTTLIRTITFQLFTLPGCLTTTARRKRYLCHVSHRKQNSAIQPVNAAIQHTRQFRHSRLENSDINTAFKYSKPANRQTSRGVFCLIARHSIKAAKFQKKKNNFQKNINWNT